MTPDTVKPATDEQLAQYRRNAEAWAESGEAANAVGVSCKVFAHWMLAILARLDAAERDRREYKERWGEYADCLQTLCMEVLYEPCRPVSHSWPGRKHVDTIREGVMELLRRNQVMRDALERADARLATATHAHEIETRRIIRAALAAAKGETPPEKP